MTRPALTVTPLDDASTAMAETVAARLGLVVSTNPASDLLLVVDRKGPLGITEDLRRDPVRPDFDTVAAGRGRRDPLLRAMGVHRGVVRILDITAGLGADAFALAGSDTDVEVEMIERDPLLFALLEDELARATPRGLSLAIDRPMDALEALEQAGADDSAGPIQQPDAILLDPMFASPGKAGVQRPLQLLRTLLGPLDEETGPSLLAAARRIAKRRVVVKRSPHAAPLDPSVKPVGQVVGLSVRFDIYAPRTAS